jgi:hypothetical protein
MNPSPVISLLLGVLALVVYAVPLSAQPIGSPDDVILDATYVTCSDTAECMLILRDGTIIYALGSLGTAFKVAESMVLDLQTTMEGVASMVDTKNLDSCATLGLVLQGPRFVLINTDNPAKETISLYKGTERIRKLARRKLASTIDRMTTQIESSIDTLVHVLPSVLADDLREQGQVSPVAREWKCRGSIFVIAKVQFDGRVRQAFVIESRVKGKCAALLCATGLRAVLLSTFTPATRKNGKAISTWIRVEIPFSASGRR